MCISFASLVSFGSAFCFMSIGSMAAGFSVGFFLIFGSIGSGGIMSAGFASMGCIGESFKNWGFCMLMWYNFTSKKQHSFRHHTKKLMFLMFYANRACVRKCDFIHKIYGRRRRLAVTEAQHMACRPHAHESKPNTTPALRASTVPVSACF